jgi:hypothetical protein
MVKKKAAKKKAASKKAIRKVTIEVSDVNYKHFEGIMERSKRTPEAFENVAEVISECVHRCFHTVDTLSYPFEEVVPVRVQITGLVAVPPEMADGNDIRQAATYMMCRVNDAFPYNSLLVSTAVPGKNSKALKEWNAEREDG